MRLTVGREIMAVSGPAGFYLSRFWEILPGKEDSLTALAELGRAWIRENHQNPLEVIHSLYLGVDSLLARTEGFRGLVGTLSVIHYPPGTCGQLASYVLKYHPAVHSVIEPIERFDHREHNAYLEASRGWARPEAFRRLCATLRKLDPKHPVPFLLHVYLKQGAVLFGDFAVEKASGKFLIPLFIDCETFRRAAARLRASAAHRV